MICKTCKADLPPTSFYMRSNRTSRMSECKECWKGKVKQRRLVDPKVRAYDRARAKTPERIARSLETTRKWRAANPEAYRAQCAVNNAVRDGRLDRKPCEVCASTSAVHAHHKDYAKPLDVVWLCARCHHRLHALFPELEGSNKTKEAV